MKREFGEVVIGYEIPVVTKVAATREWTGETSQIHEADYAEKVGMRGALLGGSQLITYISQMLYGFFGENWLSHGRISVTFVGGGVIPGDVVTAKGRVVRKEDEKPGVRIYLDIWMENQDGRRVVVGTASCLI